MARLATDEGMHLDVSTGGEYHVARAAGRAAPSRLVLHGNNKSTEELRTALAEGVGRIVVDSFDELDRIEALVAAGPVAAQGAGADHAGRRGPHPRVRAHRPGRLQVRLRRGVGRGGRGAGPGRGLRRRRAGRACTPTSAARCSRPGSSSWPSRRWPRSSPSTRWPSCPSAAASAWPTSRARRRRRSPSGPTAVHRACAQAGITARVTAEPGRSIVAAAAVTLYTVGTIKDLPGIRTYVSVDGGMSDNPRPVLYGSGYETFLARAVERRSGPAGARWWASTASRATCWCARAGCPRPGRGRHPVHAGHRCLRPLDGLQLQQGAAPGGGVRGRRRGPPGGAARDRSTTCWPATSADPVSESGAVSRAPDGVTGGRGALDRREPGGGHRRCSCRRSNEMHENE